MGLLALPLAIPEWRQPEWHDAPILLVLGVVTFLAQQSFTRSFVFAPPAIVMPAYYTLLPFAAVVGFFMFDEVPDIWVWAGAAVICASTYYITRSDQRAEAARASKE
jgi:drug/metabolite transporter (DMT)-like permease